MSKTSGKSRSASSPADAYFRSVFSITEVARQLIRFQMPADMLSHLDLDTLDLAPESFVDARLRKSLSDLVYTCRTVTDADTRICLLFEHKSYPPGRLIYPQISRYLSGIQEQDVKQKRVVFTLTVPILFYHGEQPLDLPPLEDLYGDFPEEMAGFILGIVLTIEHVVTRFSGGDGRVHTPV